MRSSPVTRAGLFSLLGRCPALTHLRLNQPGSNPLSYGGLRLADAEELFAACPHLALLEAELAAPALHALGRARLWTRLRELVLSGLPPQSPRAADEEAAAAGQPPAGPWTQDAFAELAVLRVRRHPYCFKLSAVHNWLPRLLRCAAPSLQELHLQLPIRHDVDRLTQRGGEGSAASGGGPPRHEGAPPPPHAAGASLASVMLQRRARRLRRQRSEDPGVGSARGQVA